MFSIAFLTSSSGPWADTAAIVQTNWYPEVEPLIEGQKRDALKMTKHFGVQIGCVITRRTVRGNK